jgi:hypothetical protein
VVSIPPSTYIHVLARLLLRCSNPYVHRQRLTLQLALRGARQTAAPQVSYSDTETDKLRAAICELGGGEDVEEALMKLKRQGRLGELNKYMSPGNLVCDMLCVRGPLSVWKTYLIGT